MAPERYDKSVDLENTFRIFDENGDHFITAQELKSVMQKLGQNLSDDEINLMITEADTVKKIIIFKIKNLPKK